MSISRFVSAIQTGLDHDYDLAEFVKILREHRDLGLTQKDACKLLESMRVHVDDVKEDRILEILDVASGFCQAKWHVWTSWA